MGFFLLVLSHWEFPSGSILFFSAFPPLPRKMNCDIHHDGSQMPSIHLSTSPGMSASLWG